MADNIQSLLQQLAGTGSAGQAWLPSSVNNGNPNTVYNQPPAEGGYIPPTSDAQGNWMINKPAPQTTVDWSKLVTDPKAATQNLLPVWDISNSVPPAIGPTPVTGQPSTGTPQPTPVTPTPKPAPVVPGNYQWVVMNGKVPGMNTQLYNSDPRYRAAWDQAVKEHKSTFNGKTYTKDSSVDSIVNRLKQLYGDPNFSGASASQTQQGGGGGAGGNMTGGGKTTAFLGVGGAPSASQGPVKGQGNWSFTGNAGGENGLQGLQNLPDGIQAALGVSPEGSLNWQQIADFVLPGNVYLSQTGQWDASNFIAAMLGEITGLPIDSLLTKLGQWQAGQDDPENWFEKMLIDHYMDKAQNQLAGKLNMSTQQFKAQIAPLLSQQIAQSVDMSGIKMQDSAVDALLKKAEAKMNEKLAEKEATKGGRGGEGGTRPAGDRGVGIVGSGGGGAPGASYNKGPGTTSVGEVKPVKQK